MNFFFIKNVIEIFYERINFDIEMYIYNDFGMVIVNVFVGIVVGVNYVGVIVNGLGERVGNVVLEEVLMVFKCVYKCDLNNIDIRKFRGICEYVV